MEGTKKRHCREVVVYLREEATCGKTRTFQCEAGNSLGIAFEGKRWITVQEKVNRDDGGFYMAVLAVFPNRSVSYAEKVYEEVWE